MTLSNFDWTDKTSIKWFLMLPSGHEGPYSLAAIEQRVAEGSLARDVKIWAEGLNGPIPLTAALQSFGEPEVTHEDEVPPPLPDLPIEESESKQAFADIPSVPVQAKKKTNVLAFTVVFLGIVLLFGVYQWVKGQENVSIRRYSRMSPELHGRIEKELKFEGWNKGIFFREYVPADLSHIWLVTSSFQKCGMVEATFQSITGNLISLEKEKVLFRSHGKLENHIVEFSSFDFTSGNKILPGMYEMDVKASQCEWGSLAAKLSNVFTPADEVYVGRMKVVLFHKGATEFNLILSKLLRKKMDNELKDQGEEDLFWQEMQQKFQTLHAMGMQIEQQMLDFIEKGPKNFKMNLKSMVDFYTVNSGNFLTKFVISNEAYFKELSKKELKNISKKRNYEFKVKTTSLKLGHESMKIIEELQKLNNPNLSQLKSFEKRIKDTFSLMKKEINQKIIEISEDRSS